jgi:hypothetical protein
MGAGWSAGGFGVFGTAAGLTTVKATGNSGVGTGAGGLGGGEAADTATDFARGALRRLLPSTPPATPTAATASAVTLTIAPKLRPVRALRGARDGAFVTARGGAVTGVPRDAASPEIDERSTSDVAVRRAKASTSNGGGVVIRSSEGTSPASPAGSGVSESGFEPASGASGGGYVRAVMIDGCPATGGADRLGDLLTAPTRQRVSGLDHAPAEPGTCRRLCRR